MSVTDRGPNWPFFPTPHSLYRTHHGRHIHHRGPDFSPKLTIYLGGFSGEALNDVCPILTTKSEGADAPIVAQRPGIAIVRFQTRRLLAGAEMHGAILMMPGNLLPVPSTYLYPGLILSLHSSIEMIIQGPHFLSFY